MNGQEVSKYFRNKGDEWSRLSGNVENHLKKVQKDGLKLDFQSDPNFRVVCEYLKQMGELQLRSTIGKSLEDLVGGAFGIPLVGTLDIVISAAVESCGDTTLGDKLLGAGAIASVITLGGLILGAIFTD